MKTLGIVGGLGPESTIEYYRRITARYGELRPDTAPSLVINSIDVNKGLLLLGAGQLPELADYLVQALQPLARAGANFAVISANSPHLVFDEVRARSPLPLISIVEATCAQAQAQRLSRLALLGTRFTMQSDFFPKVFSRAGMALVAPEGDEMNYVHDKYINELLKGVVSQPTREGLIGIIERLKQQNCIEGVILGGTELSLIFREPSVAGIPALDTTQIHVEAAVQELLRD